MRNRATHHRGFTLIELVVTLALIATVTAYGLPMFERLVTNSRLTAQANGFLSALLHARTEAVKRGVRVTLCKSSDGATCTTSGGWDQGWIAFTDAVTIGSVDGGDTILRSAGPLTGPLTFSGAGNVADYISYLATGRTQMAGGVAQSGTLTLAHARLSDLDRQVTITRGGRAKVQE